MGYKIITMILIVIKVTVIFDIFQKKNLKIIDTTTKKAMKKSLLFKM